MRCLKSRLSIGQRRAPAFFDRRSGPPQSARSTRRGSCPGEAVAGTPDVGGPTKRGRVGASLYLYAMGPHPAASSAIIQSRLHRVCLPIISRLLDSGKCIQDALPRSQPELRDIQDHPPHLLNLVRDGKPTPALTMGRIVRVLSYR